MITPEMVKLADRVPEIEKKLVEARAKNAKSLAEEMERHYKAKAKLLEPDTSALAAELSKAAAAKKAIFDLVPLDVRRAVDAAGAAYRRAEQEIKHERSERAAAAEALEGCEGGKTPEREALEEQLAKATDALKRAEDKLSELKVESVKAAAALDAAVQKIRREALAAPKAERAARG